MGYFDTGDAYYQTIHEKKLIGGAISRVDEGIWDFYKSDSLMIYLLNLHTEQLPERVFTQEETERFYATFRPELILVSPSYRNSKVEECLLTNLSSKISYREEHDGYLLIGLKKQDL